MKNDANAVAECRSWSGNTYMKFCWLQLQKKVSRSNAQSSCNNSLEKHSVVEFLGAQSWTLAGINLLLQDLLQSHVFLISTQLKIEGHN